MSTVTSLDLSQRTLNTEASQIFTKLPSGFLPYGEFFEKFSSVLPSTEKGHDDTKNLSQTMQADVVKGLKMLFDVDQALLDVFEQFIPVIETHAQALAARTKTGGRVFLIGSGSSGRVAVDIAAKFNRAYPSRQNQICGIIAGGDSALVRAKENFEDSETNGEECLKSFHLTEVDTVFPISSSGSATFNVGCSHLAANEGAQVFYFYNSKDIPLRTKQLFERKNNPVHPLELEIGPQAIAGSTRLQGASIAELCLGAFLGTALLHCEGKTDEANKYSQDLLVKMKEGNQLIQKQLEAIAKFVQKEVEVFLSPQANFRRVRDETSQGYVTVIGGKNTLLESLIDATEIYPTFSLNPIQREKEIEQKRGEFRAYLVGEKNNLNAWQALLGRDIDPNALDDINQFLLALEAEGIHSYAKRPTGTGNFVLGVVKIAEGSEIPNDILEVLRKVQSKGGNVGLIVLSRGKILTSNLPPLVLCLEDVPFDHLGIVETLVLKQILNLISNGSMVLVGKVHGNRMVDVRASNGKLIDRSIRLIKEIWQESNRPMPWKNDEELYHYVAHVSALKKSFTESNIYTPSVVKIVLAMLYLDKKPIPGQFQAVLDFLAQRQERLDFLCTT